MRDLVICFLLVASPVADKRKPTAAECAAIARYDDHARAEVRGQKSAELEPECKPAPVSKKKRK